MCCGTTQSQTTGGGFTRSFVANQFSTTHINTFPSGWSWVTISTHIVWTARTTTVGGVTDQSFRCIAHFGPAMARKSVGFGANCVCTCCDLGARVGRGDANEAGGGGAGSGAAEAGSGVDRGDGGMAADGNGDANAIVGSGRAWIIQFIRLKSQYTIFESTSIRVWITSM